MHSKYTPAQIVVTFSHAIEHLGGVHMMPDAPPEMWSQDFIDEVEREARLILGVEVKVAYYAKQNVLSILTETDRNMSAYVRGVYRTATLTSPNVKRG